MDFGTIKTPVEVIKEGAFGETFILMLTISGIKNHGKNLMCLKMLTKIIIVQIIMMLVLINIVSNVKHH